jgi:hypothetical protein
MIFFIMIFSKLPVNFIFLIFGYLRITNVYFLTKHYRLLQCFSKYIFFFLCFFLIFFIVFFLKTLLSSFFIYIFFMFFYKSMIIHRHTTTPQHSAWGHCTWTANLVFFFFLNPRATHLLKSSQEHSRSLETSGLISHLLSYTSNHVYPSTLMFLTVFFFFFLDFFYKYF